MEIDGDAPGSGHDQIVVDGTLSLDGTLELAFGPGVTPVVGDSWILFAAGVLGGDFADIVAPGHEGLRFGLLRQGSNGILTVQPVPLPGGIVLLPGALLLCLSRRRVAQGSRPA